MPLYEEYPVEWKEIEDRKISEKDIDEYFLRFINRILKKVQKGETDEDSIGDVGGIGLTHAQNRGYKFDPDLYEFLVQLWDYQMVMPTGEVGGELDTPEEVEKELKKIAKKLKISLN